MPIAKLTLSEVAAYLGVSIQRAHQVAFEGRHGFPEPVQRQPWAWRKTHVERWGKD